MLTTPRDAKPDQNGLGGIAVRLLCEVGRSAACTAHAAGRLKASGTAITGTAVERLRGKALALGHNPAWQVVKLFS